MLVSAELTPLRGHRRQQGEQDRRRRGGLLTPRGDRAADGVDRLMRGRFEAQFEGMDAAKAAARDARAIGFSVDLRQDSTGWLALGRRELPFPGDERDRYASRFHAIATQHGGAYRKFVEEPPGPSSPPVSGAPVRGAR